VRANQAGGWHVELNSDTLPKVLANERYYAEISGSTRNKADKEFLAERWNTANWLVKALDQRARTILRVAREIVRQQDMFLLKGVEHLRPLVLRDIAEALELHESTISRVTSNKYMATPRGIFELKYFFTAAIGSTGDGPAHSAESVRHRIKALIDAEPPNKVLSDDNLVEILRTDGIEIARRTVAKYRESMRIPSSVQRRRDKKTSSTSTS
jgi:RNA polymerase sigma-54 factor